MVEVKFKPADVGSVADGAVTAAKLASAVANDIAAKAYTTDVNSALSAKADTSTVNAALATKVDGTGTTGNKKVLKLGWDSATGEVVVDHEA